MRLYPNSRQCGFTLIELVVVMAIIGILISLILVAGADGVRRAEERQTQALIAKLETALNDRIDALLATPAPINQTHRYLASITFTDPSTGLNDPIAASVDRRAQVIAQFDFMKAELPDVFYVSNFDANYPFNFGMPPYPVAVKNPSRDNFILPLGNRNPGLPYTQQPSVGATGTYLPTPGFSNVGQFAGFNASGVDNTLVPAMTALAQDSGLYGASYTAAGGLYKNLYETVAQDLIAQLGPTVSLNPKLLYDSVDNDLTGYADEMIEITATLKNVTFAQFQTAVSNRLAKHDHKTARSEMLYALLVEGQGPLGSAYNRDDFTNRDVADTDGDGLPEFIDAWGQPLQFYRWPIYYGSGSLNAINSASGSQMGFMPYNVDPTSSSITLAKNIPRQLDPLDPNQLLVATSWWSTYKTPQGTSFNVGLPAMNGLTSGVIPDFSTPYPSSNASPQANAFMTYFHILIDPSNAIQPTNANPVSPNWDRTGLTRRRAYYSKFLVLSGGPDMEIGVFRLNKDYYGDIGQNDQGNNLAPAYPPSTNSPPNGFPTGNPITDAQLINWCESQAAQVDFANRSGVFLEMPYGGNNGQASPTSYFLQNQAGLDDITSHSLSAPGAAAK